MYVDVVDAKSIKNFMWSSTPLGHLQDHRGFYHPFVAKCDARKETLLELIKPREGGTIAEKLRQICFNNFAFFGPSVISIQNIEIVKIFFLFVFTHHSKTLYK